MRLEIQEAVGSGSPGAWQGLEGHSRRHLALRSGTPSRQGQADHGAFRRENKSVPRERKSCWHRILLLAGGQGHSLQRRATSLRRPGPGTYMVKRLGIPEKKPTASSVDPSNGRKRSLDNVSASVTGYSHG